MKNWLNLLLVWLLLSGCTAKHLEIFPALSDPSLMTTKLSVEEMHEDIDALIAGAKARHPALQDYADMGRLESAVTALKKSIKEPLLRTEFYRHVGTLTHLFQDGHSLLIWPYQELKALNDTGEKLFPFDIVITHEQQLLIKHSYQSENQNIPAGSEIVSINGLTASDFLAQLQQYASGETAWLRTQFIAARFGLMLWAAKGLINDFEVTLKHEQVSTTYNIHKEQDWQSVAASEMANEDHYYKNLEGDIGYLYLDHFDIDPGDFEDFIDSTFEQIRSENIKHLIIDVRQNPGGNTDTVTYLSRYLAHKPFRLVSSMREKLHGDNRGWFNQKGEPGDILEQEWDDWQQPMNPEERFEGDVYLLTGGITYSAAIVLATTLKDNKFARLVGETTGGFANQTAQGNLFNLPNSELRAYIATRLLVRPSGDTKRTGVIPDVEVIPTREDIANQTDAVLNKVMALIKANRTQQTAS